MPMDPGDWQLNGELGHWLWREVQQSAYLYWPNDTDAFIELHLDTYSRQNDRLQRTAGVQSTDGDYVTFEDDTDWFNKSGLGYMSQSWRFIYNKRNFSRVQFWGHIYSTTGTRFWFEVLEESEGSPLYVDRLRIPVPDGMVDEVVDWCESGGGEHLHTKGAVFEERFDTNGGGGNKFHNDVHCRFEDQSAEQVKDILSDSIDFVERAARAEGGQRFTR